MTQNLSEELQCCFTLTNFRTKPNVSKRKLGEEFVQKDWNVCSVGFTAEDQLTDLSFFPKEDSKRLFPKLNGNEFEVDDWKSGAEIPHIESEFFPRASKSFNAAHHHKSLPKLTKSVYDRNKFKLDDKHIATNCPSSVFLEVQNIQNAFQRNIPNIDLKPSVKLSSEFVKQFKTNLISKSNGEQENAQSIRKTFQKNKSRPPVKLSSEFAKKFKTSLLPKSNEENAVKKNRSNINLKHPEDISSEFCKTINAHMISKCNEEQENIQRIQNLSQKDKYKATVRLSSEFAQDFKHRFITRDNQQIAQYVVIQNRPNINRKPSIELSSESTKFTIDLLPKNNIEHGIVPKKRKFCDGTFIIPSVDFLSSCTVREVQKIKSSVSSSLSPCVGQRSFDCTVVKGSAVQFQSSIYTATESDIKVESTPREMKSPAAFYPSKTNSFVKDQKHEKIPLVKFSTLLEDKSLGSKGSNWVQLLQPAPLLKNEDTYSEDPVGRKKIRNTLQGGFAEQILKSQRREKSEKVIWDHKIDRCKKKALNKSLSLVLTAVSHTDEMVVVKVSSLNSRGILERDGEELDVDPSLLLHFNKLTREQLCGMGREKGLEMSSSSVFLILFKRSAFNKLNLKVKDTFQLYPPWQTLHLESVPYPVILCAYFVDSVVQFCNEIGDELPVEKSVLRESGISEPLMMLKSNVHPIHENMLFYQWGELVTFSARIQRIWQREVVYSSATHLRYSFLLQTYEGLFHELRLSSHSDTVPNFWYEIISYGEGKCYLFRNLRITHRICMKKEKHFFDILQSLQQHSCGDGSKMKQDFCYQLMLDCSSTALEEINEEAFPDYCPITIKPLVHLLKEGTMERFTCLCKILLQYKNIFYVSDESLLHPSSSKYVQMQFLFPFESKATLTGSTVLIKEALFYEGCLILDNYSQLIPLCESSSAFQRLSLDDKGRLKQIADVDTKRTILPLKPCSEVTELVCIKGEIRSVDESSAVTWLQCHFCSKENLVQDANLVIYCEDCSRIVPNPVLNIKMEVVVCCHGLTSTIVNVQLLSSTIKRILLIPEDIYQPQCSVSEVLGKQIGPLYCYVRSCEKIGDEQVFYLSEVSSS